MFTHSLTFDFLIRQNMGPSASLPLPKPTPGVPTGVSVTLFPTWLKHIAVQWSIPSSWGHCLFNVYFSQDESSEFTKINVTPIDGSYLIDDGTQEYRRYNNGFYVVEVLPQDANSTVGVVKSMPTTWNPAQNNFVYRRAKEINRREHWLLVKFVGIKSYVFKRKSYGKRCHNCWDHSAEKIMKDNCEVCMGTGFEGGYFSPIPCYFQYDPAPNQERRDYTGIMEPNSTGAWTIAFPQLHPDDVVIRTGDWRAYRIDAISPTELQGNTVRQMARLTELNKTMIEYKLTTRNLPEYPTEYL